MIDTKDQFAQAVQPPYYDAAAYDSFIIALSNLEAVVSGDNVAMYAAGDKFTMDILHTADKLPLDIALRDISAVVGPMQLRHEYPFAQAIDTYITGRVNPLSFTDNYAALVYYDLINGKENGTYTDVVSAYAGMAGRAFQAMGSLEAQVAALDHVYGINENEDAATDIDTLPPQSQNLLKELFAQTVTLLLQVCHEGQTPDAAAARKILTERLEVAETILGHSDLVHTIERMYLEDTPPEEFSEDKIFRRDPAADGPKPV